MPLQITDYFHRAYAGVSSVDSNGFDFIYLTFPFPGRTTPLSCNIGTLLQDGYLGRVDPTYLNAHFETMAMAPVRFDPAIGDVSFEVQGLYGSHAAIDTPVIWSSSYEYNPHWAFTSAYGKWSGGGTINTGVDTVSWYTSVNGYNAHKALVTDLNSCGAEGNPNYLGLAPHKAGAFWVYNLGYVDGHVASVRDRVMMNCPKGSYLGYAIRIPSETEGYDSVLDALEAEAENRDPVTSGGDPRMPPLTRALGTGGSSTPWEYRLQGGNAGNVPGEQTNPSKPGYGLYHPLVPWQ